MAENISEIGNIAIISGIPDRVAAPIERIDATSSELTQRYYQHKQAFGATNTALANMPRINGDVAGEEIIQGASKYVNDEFKSVIDSDNWQHAEEKVLTVANKLSTDEGLKTVSYNTAAIKSSNEAIDGNEKLAEKYKQGWKSLNQNMFIEGGGSKDEKGNFRKFSPLMPKTDMDVFQYVKDFDSIVSKMKASKSYFQTGIHEFTPTNIKAFAAGDEKVEAMLTQMYDEKISITELTDEKLEQSITNRLKANPIFGSTVQEVNMMEHYMATGRKTANNEDFTNLLNDYKSDSTTRSLILQNSGYASKLEAINTNYNQQLASGDTNAQRNRTASINALNSNVDRYIEEGKQNLTKLLKNKDGSWNDAKANSVVMAVKNQQLTNNVISTATAYSYSEKDSDREYLDNWFGQEYLRKALDKEDEIAYPTTSTEGVATAETVLNEDAMNIDSQESVEQLKTIADNNPTDENIQAYQTAKGHLNTKIEVLKQTYNNMSPEAKKEAIAEAASIHPTRAFSQSSTAIIRSGMDNIFDKSRMLNKPFGSSKTYRDIQTEYYTKYNPNKPNELPKDFNASMYLTDKITVDDLLNLTDDEIINKYDTKKVLSNPVKQNDGNYDNIKYFKEGLKGARDYMTKAIIKQSGGSLNYTTNIQAINHYGKESPITTLAYDAMRDALFTGNTTFLMDSEDIKANAKILPKYLDEIGFNYKGSNGKGDADVNFNAKDRVEIKMLDAKDYVITDGGIPFMATYNGEFPDEKGNNKDQTGLKQVYAVYHGGSPAVDASLKETAIKLYQQNKSGKYPVLASNNLNTIFSISRMFGYKNEIELKSPDGKTIKKTNLSPFLHIQERDMKINPKKVTSFYVGDKHLTIQYSNPGNPSSSYVVRGLGQDLIIKNIQDLAIALGAKNGSLGDIDLSLYVLNSLNDINK